MLLAYPNPQIDAHAIYRDSCYGRTEWQAIMVSLAMYGPGGCKRLTLLGVDVGCFCMNGIVHMMYVVVVGFMHRVLRIFAQEMRVGYCSLLVGKKICGLGGAWTWR